MFKGQKLRALVNERLAAAAEEIFALFERTIAEYEEELCRSKEENHQLQGSRLLQHKEAAPEPSPSYDPKLNQEITTTQIKQEPEEQCHKQEEEPLPVSAPCSSDVYVKKREKSSQFLQEQNEHRVKTQGEDLHFQSETEGDIEHSYDTDNDWEPQFACLDEQMETGVVHCKRNQISNRSTTLCPQNKPGPEKSARNNENISGIDDGGERNKHQCSVCQPYSCSTCKTTFAKKTDLVVHRRIHTGEKAYSCSLCDKSYSAKDCLKAHMRTHTGESLHSCSLCGKSFPKRSHLEIHMRSHTGEKPYICLFCDKAFSVNSNLRRHLRTHTEEKQ